MRLCVWGACGRPADAQVTAVCQCEHLTQQPACAHHTAEITKTVEAGGQIMCNACKAQGHECRMVFAIDNEEIRRPGLYG